MSTRPSAAPEPIDLLVGGGYVLTLDDRHSVYYPGSVAIGGGRILAVGPSADVDARFAPLERVDARDHAVLPGLVNIHGHASNSLIRGLGSDLDLHDWLQQVCWPYMDRANDDDLHNGVLLSCLEMLLNGVTTFADMWVGVGAAAEAVAASGQRALLAHNIKDFGEARRGERELATALDAWRHWNGYADGRVIVGLGPHSVYTCQPELLRECAEVAREMGIRLQIHGAETAREVAECQAAHGETPIGLMAETGLLGERTIVAHAVHLDERDVALLRSSGSAVAHNLASNLKLASGIAPVQRYLAGGIPVGMGTDGPGSNDALDLLADLKYAALLQKAVTGDATCLPADTALRMVTRNGAQALGLANRIGSLEVDKLADLILVDLDRPRFTPHHFGSPDNIASHLVNCATGADVDTVIVAGKVLVRDGQPLYLDTARVQQRAQRSSEKLVGL